MDNHSLIKQELQEAAKVLENFLDNEQNIEAIERLHKPL